MPEPSRLTIPFANSGKRNDIPAQKEQSGFASWEKGFDIETEIPLDAGGSPPRRDDFNGIFHAISLIAMWAQQGGQYAYSETVNYEPGNIVLQNNALYFCIAANGPASAAKSPADDTGGEYWKLVLSAAGALNVPKVEIASTDISGTVRLATQAETRALTERSAAVTPYSLNGLLSTANSPSLVPKADASGKITGWINGLKNDAGKVEIDITGSSGDSDKLEGNTLTQILQKVYPVGAIYISEKATNPSVLLGFGTWTAIRGRVLMGESDKHAAGAQGGSENHTLTVSELPSHNHTASMSSSGGHTHSGTTSTSGVHHHGSMGHDYNRGNTWNGWYDSSNKYLGLDGYDNNNSLVNTTNNGEHNHTFTTSSAGVHAHDITIGSTGGGNSFSTLPPYLAVYIWKRTA